MRSRAVALGVAGVVVVLAVALALLSGGDDGTTKGAPPASAAATLVPADALVYVHLSTDRDRAETRAAAKLAATFPSWPALRDVFTEVMHGDATYAFQVADIYFGRDTDGTFNDNSTEAFLAINCLDYRSDSSIETMRAEEAELVRLAPVLGRQRSRALILALLKVDTCKDVRALRRLYAA